MNNQFVKPSFTSVPTRQAQYVHITMNNAQSVAPNTNIRFNNLKEPSKQDLQSVGIGVTTQNPVPTNASVSSNVKESKEVKMSFNKLYTQKVSPQTYTFKAQALDDGVVRSMLPNPAPKTESVEAINQRLSKEQQTQTNGKKPNNWFSRTLEQRGQDCFSSGKVSVDVVSKNAERILNEMVSGRVDYEKFASCIIEPVVLNTLINYCANKLAINKALQFSLGYTYKDYVDRAELANDPNRYMTICSIDDGLSRNITQSISIVNSDISYYAIIHDKLVYVDNTKNVSALYSLTNELNNYMKKMATRY